MSWKKQTKALMMLGVLSLLLPCRVVAQTSSSNGYRVEEAQFGSGGGVDLNSPAFNAQAGLGSLGVGDASSTNFDATAGFITPGEPYLEFVVSASTVDLGTLNESTTGTGTATFYVRTYLSGTYSVVTLSQPPTSEGGATLAPLTTGGTATPGTEQFGINLVDNSSPNIGLNRVNVPSDSFADGQAATGYNTPNSFRYVVGETVARSQATIGNPAIGQTTYTISYIANVGAITEAGSYTMRHDLAAIATF